MKSNPLWDSKFLKKLCESRSENYNMRIIGLQPLILTKELSSIYSFKITIPGKMILKTSPSSWEKKIHKRRVIAVV